MYCKAKHKHQIPRWDTLGAFHWMLKNRVVKINSIFSVSFLKINIYTYILKNSILKESSSSTTGVKVHPSLKVLFTSLQSFKHCINYLMGVRIKIWVLERGQHIKLQAIHLYHSRLLWQKEMVTLGIVFHGLSCFQCKTSQKSSFGDKICLLLNCLSLSHAHFPCAVPGFGGLWHVPRQQRSPLLSGGHSRA